MAKANNILRRKNRKQGQKYVPEINPKLQGQKYVPKFNPKLQVGLGNKKGIIELPKGANIDALRQIPGTTPKPCEVRYNGYASKLTEDKVGGDFLFKKIVGRKNEHWKVNTIFGEHIVSEDELLGAYKKIGNDYYTRNPINAVCIIPNEINHGWGIKLPNGQVAWIDNNTNKNIYIAYNEDDFEYDEDGFEYDEDGFEYFKYDEYDEDDEDTFHLLDILEVSDNDKVDFVK